MSDVFVSRTDPLKQLQDLQQETVKKDQAEPGKFAELLKNALGEVNQLQQVSDQQIGKIMSGEINDVHSAMIAMQKADLSFQLIMQVRNKLVDAYQEVMRMQV